MSEVYFIRATSAEPDDIVEKKIRLLFEKANLKRAFKPKDIAALKLHVGDPGTRTHVKPAVVRSLVSCVKDSGAKPFLTDTSVLYKSKRSDGIGHAEVAANHGFDVGNVGASFIPADGILGKDAVSVPVEGRHYKEVAIASAIVQARSMLVLTHITGHLGVGYGGVLKNLGMGCSTKAAKLSQHSGHQPSINPKLCTACGECADNCPEDAILVERFAVIEKQKCIGCGECIAVCREDAVKFRWSAKTIELEERIVEHAAGVARQKGDAVCYVSAAVDITKDCDCMGLNQKPLLPDIGYLASFDPVSLEKAGYDLIVERAGRTLESMSYPEQDGAHQIGYAESMGLGSSRYELLEIS